MAGKGAAYVEGARHVRIASTGDFNALFLVFQGFEAAPEYVVSYARSGNRRSTGIPLLDPLPRHAV